MCLVCSPDTPRDGRCETHGRLCTRIGGGADYCCRGQPPAPRPRIGVGLTGRGGCCPSLPSRPLHTYRSALSPPLSHEPFPLSLCGPIPPTAGAVCRWCSSGSDSRSHHTPFPLLQTLSSRPFSDGEPGSDRRTGSWGSTAPLPCLPPSLLPSHTLLLC